MIHKVFLLWKVVRQQGVTALLLYQDQTVSLVGCREANSPKDRQTSFLNFKGCRTAPADGSLLHGHVTALSKAGQEVLETIAQSA